jgi:hypothetical protein
MSSTRLERKLRARAEPAAAHDTAPARRRVGGAGTWTAGALALLHLTLCLAAFNPTPHTGGDNAIFVSLGRALLDGAGYVDLWDPARPPHVLVPPVFPTVLAGAMALGLEPWVGLKGLVMLFSVAAVALSFLWMRRVTTPGVALGAGLVLALAPGVVNLSYWVLSDVPFWAMTMLALWAAARAEPPEGSFTATPQGERAPGRGIWMAVAGAAVILALFTRSAGLPLALAFGVWMFVHAGWRPFAAFVTAAGVPTLAWMAYVRGAEAATYGSQFLQRDPYRPELGTIGPADLAVRIAENAWRYLTLHLPELLVGRGGAWAVAVAAAVAALAAAGFARRVRTRSLAAFLLPLYAGLLLVWPATWSGERFLLPVLPLLLLFAGEATRDLAARAPRPRVLALSACVALVALGIPGTATYVSRGVECRAQHAEGAVAPCRGPLWQDLFAVAADARWVLPPGSRVFSRKPVMYYVLSGHTGRLYPMDPDPQNFFHAADTAEIGYVVLDRLPDLAPQYLRPVVERRPDRFCIVERLSRPDAMTLRILPEGAVPPDAAAELSPGRFFYCDAFPLPAP